MAKTSTFHQVHVHSEYSILDGTGFVEEYVDLAVKNRMGYVCITDHGMAGAWPTLMDTCEKSGVRPVFGVELYLNDYNMLVPNWSNLSDEMKKKVRQSDHMLVFAETEAGYANLIKLVSMGWERGFYYNPRVSWQELCDHSDGLVITTGCLASPLNRTLARENPEKAKEMLRRWKEVWDGRMWVEWQMIDIDDQDANNPKLMQLAEDLGIPPIVTNDCLDKDTLVLCVGGLKKIKDIEVGSYVLTHRGRFKKVYQKVAKLSTQSRWEITGKHLGYRKDKVVATADHRFYVVDPVTLETSWVTAENLDPSKHRLYVPRSYEDGLAFGIAYPSMKKLFESKDFVIPTPLSEISSGKLGPPNFDNSRRLNGHLVEFTIRKLDQSKHEYWEGYPVYDIAVEEDESFCTTVGVVHNCHYALPDHAYLQKVQLLVQSRGGTIQNPQGLVFDSTCHWYKNEAQMDERWDAKYRKLMGSNDDFYLRSKKETLELCQRCGYVTPDRTPKLPVVDNADEKMRAICYDALRKLGLDEPRYHRQLEEELYLISKKDFSSYFLLQVDVIKAIRKMGADVGPGRGSVGGCLSAGLMGITKIDPVKHGLLFSRFLSPSRGGCQMCLNL